MKKNFTTKSCYTRDGVTLPTPKWVKMWRNKMKRLGLTLKPSAKSEQMKRYYKAKRSIGEDY